MAARRLRVRLVIAGVAVAAVVVLDSSGVLGVKASVVVDDAAQLAGGLLATVCCGWAAGRASGVERAWLRLMAVGMAGWSAGQIIWSWYQIFAATPLPSPAWSDVGYLALPVFAVAAMSTLAAGYARRRGRAPTADSPARSRWVLVLDGLIVVGSLFVLTWATALGAVVRAGAPDPLAFAVAIAYPVTDLVLVVMAVLLLTTRSVPTATRPRLVLLGMGLVGLSLSDSIFAYLVSSGATEMPPIANVGFVAGPVLVALAALQDGGGSSSPAHRRSRPVGWFQLLLPYLPLSAMGVLIVGALATGRGLDPVDTAVGVAVVGLVVVRQMITLIDNSVLLSRVSDAQDRLAYQAFHDPLTGLANRALFASRLAAAVEGHRDQRLPVLLLFVDLDDFKAVNDSLGHAAGDRVLQAVGERLRSCVRSVDVVARLGGDEFGILVVGEVDHADPVSQRITAALRQPFIVDGRALTIGASVGAAVPDGAGPALTAEALLRRADAAMYAGKLRGKGLLVRYGPDTPDGYDNPDLPILLAEALDNGQAWSGLDVHYQPIVRLADGVTVAVEALARWSHPLVGRVPPMIFVAIAERAGLVSVVDDFVLDRACRDLAAYLTRHGRAPDLHVNVSASRLGRPDVEEVVGDTLGRYGLPACRLVLEVTEGRRIPDLAAAVGSVQRLQRMGVRLALDDFGTGYNTLALLHRLPVDIVKLDRAFTAVDVVTSRAEALCGSLVSVARSLGTVVIAEGVESRDQEAALARLGCGLGQGHLYGLPAPLIEPAPVRSLR